MGNVGATVPTPCRVRRMAERSVEHLREGDNGRVRIPPVRVPVRKSAVVRFVEKVDATPSGCWTWTGAIDRNGYPCFRHDATKWAHRASHILFKGPIPEGFTIDHLCRNPVCVNPDHLEAVTQAENAARTAGRWTSCDELHPDAATRVGSKRGRPHCLECGRIYEQRRRDRTRPPVPQPLHYRRFRK